MPQMSVADIARVMPLDFSDLLNQRDDTAPRLGVSDVGERLGQGNAISRRYKLINDGCLSGVRGSDGLCRRFIKKEIRSHL